MKWLETWQLIALVIGVFTAAFGWPLKKYLDSKDEVVKTLKSDYSDLKEKVYTNEKEQGKIIHEHDVVIAKLESGKVSHEQLRDSLADVKESMRSSVEAISNQWERLRREDREELKETLLDIKDDIRSLRDNK